VTKDLFSILFDKHSRFTRVDYTTKFLERMPERFVAGAILANPGLQTSDLFIEMKEVIESRAGTTLQNPELYPHLNRLLIPNHPFVDERVRAIRIHLGLDALAPCDESISRIWRLMGAIGGVYEITGGQIQKVDALPLKSTKGEAECPLVYAPRPHLFDDIESKCYRGQPSCDPDSLLSSVNGAYDLIKNYSPEIADGFTRTINVISFMRRDRAGVKSFSMRNVYIGGIFVSESGLLLLAEQFIHEYYHQCIWPWWLIEPPSDLPNNQDQITSPITGRLRPISVMVHALLIYCSLIDFYRFALSSPELQDYDEEEVQEARAALSRIETGVTPLFIALRTALAERPETRSIVETVANAVAL
jgi:hypothetical protein